MSSLLCFPRAFAAAAVLGGLPMMSFAADVPAAPPAADMVRAPNLDNARARIAVQDWTGAQAELRRLDARESADWNNLMGYTLRKGPQPDWNAASRYYEQALRIDPQHRGALAYSGELSLQRGDLAGAEQRQAVLERACGRQACPELTTLRDAIAQHKARRS